MPWCSLPPYPQQVAAWSELGCKFQWESEQRLSQKREGFVILLRFCIIAVSLSAVLPFRIWNKGLCFSHHLSSLFCTIHLRTDFFFVLTKSLSLIYRTMNLKVTQLLLFFFLRFGEKKKVCWFIYLVLTVLGLCFCAWVFSSCGEQGLLYSSGSRASHCLQLSQSAGSRSMGFSSWGSRA